MTTVREVDIFTYIAVLAFAGIGVCALCEQQWAVGVATICLSVANGIFLIVLA